MAKQTFTTGSVLTAAQMNSLQANDYNQTVSQKTASYVLVAADAGTRIEMNAAGATTVTVNTGLFTAGDTLFIQNIGAGACTVTAGTATVNKASAGSLTLSQYQGGTLYFISASSAIFFADAGYTPPLTTKGDLFGYDTAAARIPIGTNGQVLTADSTQALGLKWGTASGGYTLVSTTTITATNSTSISLAANSYTRIMIILENVYLGTNGEEINVRLNNDSGTNYRYFRVGGYGGTTVSYNDSGSGTEINGFVGPTGTASAKANGYLEVNRVNGTDKFTYGGNTFTTNNGATPYTRYTGGWYDGSAVISSIQIIGSNSATVTGTVYLYGI